MHIKTFISSYFFLTIVWSGTALDLERAMENENIPCFVPNQTVSIDMAWVTSVDKWYYPYSSILDLYLEGIEISGKSANELREDEIYYNSCIYFGLGEDGQSAVYGFHGEERTYVFEPINGFQSFNWKSNKPGSSHGGITYTTLTDNKTFHFSTTCQEGRMTWGVITTTKTLPKETVEMVRDHALSLGFNPDHFTGLRYDSCPELNRTIVTTEDGFLSAKNNSPSSWEMCRAQCRVEL